MGWFCGLLVAFATFLQIQATPYGEYVVGNEGSIPITGHHLQKRGIEGINIAMNSGMGTSDIFDVELTGEFFWQNLHYVDERNRKTPYYRSVSSNKTIISNYSDLSDNVLRTAIKAGLGVNEEGVVEFIEIGFPSVGSEEWEVNREYYKIITFKNDTIVREEFTTSSYSIGGMFQLMYKGPGLSYATSTVTTYGDHSSYNVTFKCRARLVPMIKNIMVVATNRIYERPHVIVTESFSGNPDINSKDAGKYVWLVPFWTTNKSEAVTKIKYIFERSSDRLKIGPALGGEFNYLEMLKDPSDNRRLKRVGLLRSPMSDPIFDERTYGWDDCTTDINSFTLRDWLFLCWNYVYV